MTTGKVTRASGDNAGCPLYRIPQHSQQLVGSLRLKATSLLNSAGIFISAHDPGIHTIVSRCRERGNFTPAKPICLDFFCYPDRTAIAYPSLLVG